MTPLAGPPLTGPALDGLCGQILKRLERKGEQGARELLWGITGSRPPIEVKGEQRAECLFRSFLHDWSPIRGGPEKAWVIAQVESELADLGYLRPTVTRPWLVGKKVQVVADCGQIQTLAEACARALDRWNRAWAADVAFCHALLIDCTKAQEPIGGEGGN